MTGSCVLAQTGCSRDVDGAPNRLALISDTHIMADPAATARGINMTDHLRQVVNAITQLDTQPSHVIVNGDLATDGSPPTPEAYKQFGRLILPMRNAGMQVHLTMGNCDRRRMCAQTLAELSPQHPPVEGRRVDIIKTEHANWFLLDSLSFDPKQPQGWVEGHATADGMRLTLHTIDADHSLSGQQVRLTWRDGSYTNDQN